MRARSSCCTVCAAAPRPRPSRPRPSPRAETRFPAWAPGSWGPVPEPDETGPRFGSGRPYSIGVEEELFLVDPVTGRQANASEAVVERVGDVDGDIATAL